MTGSIAAPAFLARFTCLGAECDDTCCKGWNMQVDPPTLARYRSQAPELLSSVEIEGEDAIMKRDAKSDFCVKFEGGLCSIQRGLGEQFLGDACYFYPRATRALGGEVSMTATLSCPEIARLALFRDDAFAESSVEAPRLPVGMQDYLPEGLTAQQAQAIHRAFLHAALSPETNPERSIMRTWRAAQSLSRITPAAWPDAVPFYLAHADATLPPAHARETDPVFLLQALCGLISAAKYVHHTRLMQTVRDMQQALHVTIPMDSLQIAALPDSAHATQTMLARWASEWRGTCAPLLRRYLAMQVSLSLFPFAGFGPTMPDRAAIIGIRFATVRLGLMSLFQAMNGAPEEKDMVRVIQSLSRFLDHLGSAEFSMKIYGETGWLEGGRLRGLLMDTA